MTKAEQLIEGIVESKPILRNLRAYLSQSLGRFATITPSHNLLFVDGVDFDEMESAVEYASRKLNRDVEYSSTGTGNHDFKVWVD